MKKILIFSYAYLPFVGGAEIAVKEITDRLSPEATAGEAEFQFDLITANLDGKQKPTEKIGNVNVYRISGTGMIGKLLFPFRAKRLAGKLHKQKNYDATWAIMASWAGIAAAMFKKQTSSIPFILTIQEGDEEEHLKRYALGIPFFYSLFIKSWHYFIFERADKTTAISNYLAERAKESGSKGEIAVIPNGVDIKLFSQDFSDSEVNTLKQKLNKQQQDIFLVTTSRLVEKNAVGDIISSLAHLPYNMKLLIIGDGYQKEELEALAKHGGVSDRVMFLGQIAHNELPKYLKVSDIFIRPSLSEGMGNSFIEAMCAEIPVIATPVGGIPDFLKDPSSSSGQATGLFCNVNDPKSIATKVTELIEHPALRNQLVENAKKLVIEKYDWNLIAEKMKTEIFSQL